MTGSSSARTLITYENAAAWDQPAWRAWDAYVQAHPAATFCHLSGWGQAIERAWGHRPCHMRVEQDGQVRAVLPLFHVSSRVFGSMLVSSPNAVYGGILADDAAAYQMLLDAAAKLAEKLGVDYLELRDSRDPAGVDNAPITIPEAQWPRKDLYVTFEHPLVADEEALMKSLPRDVRTMIRKGIKNGLTGELGREAFLDDFYDVYATSVRNLGTPVFSKKLFAELLRAFPEQSDILLIRQEGKIAGGVMSFYFRGQVLPYYGGAYPEFYRSGINNFMYWELMTRSATRGCHLFDFGRSKLNTGAYEFKRGWGMNMRPLPYRFFLVRAARLPDLNPANPKYEMMINCWKKLPLGVTKVIGPRIVKYLP
ncbi:MAG: FemAB family XrtA/PEP-CTERM system-associated protein [Blastocatellia bacterium]